jgi:4-hydroxy-tetrahydrodipicolinate synthase
MAARFGQVLTAMVTPFDEDGELDVDAAIELARWHVDHGNDGLVIAGTTGESPVLTDAERCTLIEAIAQSVTVPVIAGTTTNDTRHSVHLTRECSQLGIAAVLCVTPYYNRPSQAGIDAHVRAVAEAAGDLPVVIYDVPPRTGRKMSTSLILDLAHHVPNVLALKDAAGNPGGRRCARRLRGDERRRRDDAAAARRRCHERDRRGNGVDRARPPGDVHGVDQG